MNWRRFASCNGMNPNLFFPGRGDYYTLRAAQKVCETCPVRTDCLEYALAEPEHFGVWGGTGERERRRIRARRQRQRSAAA